MRARSRRVAGVTLALALALVACSASPRRSTGGEARPVGLPGGFSEGEGEGEGEGGVEGEGEGAPSEGEGEGEGPEPSEGEGEGEGEGPPPSEGEGEGEGPPECVPEIERCDAVDNDCDGEIDERFLDVGDSCDTGMVGPCWQGRIRCDDDGDASCTGVVDPGEEICDGVDNDCDGEADENEPGANEECETGEPGACAFGRSRCENGFLWCDRIEPSDEECDGFDNDCDGEIDEGDPGEGLECETGLEGVCRTGIGSCEAGVLTCTQQQEPSDEECDGLDNDCDGDADEDDGQGECGPDCLGIGWERRVKGGVVICYTNEARTCQAAHEACLSLGDGYRLLCGDDWQPGYDGQGCGGANAWTAYDAVNEWFLGSSAFGAYHGNRMDCVSGGLNNQCRGDSGRAEGWAPGNFYGFCSPKSFFRADVDGPEWANICGN